MKRVAVLGLGEAGRVFASALADHVEVRGWDPVMKAAIPNVQIAADAASAVAGADAVLAFTPGSRSLDALHAAVGNLSPGAMYADCATSSPALKRLLADGAALAGITFSDVAIMGPVRRGAAGTPLLASGTGATPFAELCRRAGIKVEVISDSAGDAAARKLLRSILVKGLTAVTIEALRAAEREGLLDWFAEHLVGTITALDGPTLTGFLDGTLTHSARRVDEMEAAADMVRDSELEPSMSSGAAEVLRSIPVLGIPRVAL